MKISFSFFIRNKECNKYYVITDSLCCDENKFWLANQDGEGGDFSIDKLYEVIDTFFKQNY